MSAPHQYPAPPPPPATGPRQDERGRGATSYPNVPAPEDRRPALPGAPTQTSPVYQRRHRGLRLGGLAVVGLMIAGGTLATVPEMVRDAAVEVLTAPDSTVELSLHTGMGDVEVRQVAGDGPAQVTASKHWSFREPTARLSTSGDVTSVSLDCPAIPALGQCYADWTVAVPEGTKVVVRSDVGDVDVAGVTGEVAVHGAVGDVRVSGAPSALEVSTSVGEISAVLDQPSPSVRLSSSVGDIDLRLPEDVAYDVRAESSVEPATVQVQTSGQSEYDVDVTTSVGSVLITDG